MTGETIPYALKYAPLVQCLEQRSNSDWLISHDPEIIRHFLKIDVNVLRTYTVALKRDLDELYQLALPVALKDEELAKRLTDVRETLRRFINRCRWRRYKDFMWRLAMKSPAFKAQSREADDLRFLLQSMQQLRLRLLTAATG